MGQAGPGPTSGPSRRAVEVMTAVVVAVIVASGVVAIGVVTRDDDPQITADPGPGDSPSPTPDVVEPETSPPEQTSEPEDGSTEESPEPTAEPAEPAEVTDVELTVDQHEYTGRCPVTLEFSARITTNTGPVKADYSWLDVDSNEVSSDSVQFGGPGPQGVTVTHAVEVVESAAIQRTLDVTAPNRFTSDPADATVTCTPYAEVTKGGDTFDAGAGLCHMLQFDATITVPQDMTVTYEWLRSDGAIDTTGPHTVEFSGGGTQTESIPGKTWNLGDLEGEYGYRLHLIEPYDVMSELVTYKLSGCSGPAT